MIDLNKVLFKYENSNSQPFQLKIDELKIPTGSKIFIHGPSGSGKTTFLEILGGVLLPQSGQVKILNTDFMKTSARQRDAFRADHIGFIFQNFNLISYLSVQENILLPCFFSKSSKQPHPKIPIWIEKLGLQNFLQTSVSQLSHGQQQRVALLRALAASPEIILADEPTSALDSQLRDVFMNALLELINEEKKTLLFVSHDESLQKYFDQSIDIRKYSATSGET